MTKRIMRAFKLNEISAVDNPAQEHARMVIMKRDDDHSIEFDADGNITVKRDFDAAQRRSAAASGDALPDGSFPIKNKEDLANARRLVGHAKDKAAAEAHIRRRAKALGVSLDKSEGVLTMDITNEDLAKMIEDAVVKSQKEADGKLEKVVAEFAKAETDLAISRLPETHKAYYDNLEDEHKPSFLAKSADERAIDIAKAQPKLSPDLQKMLDEARANEVILKGLLEDREMQKFAKKALDIGLQEIHGEVLRKAYKGDEKAIGKLEELFKGLTEQVRTGKLFSEFGTQKAAPVTAAAEMDSKVDEMVKAHDATGNPITREKAFVKIYENKANVELKHRFDAEDLRKRQSALGTVV